MKNEPVASGFSLIQPDCLLPGWQGASDASISCPLSRPRETKSQPSFAGIVGSSLRWRSDSAGFQFSSWVIISENVNGRKCQSQDMKRRQNSSHDVQVTFSSIPPPPQTLPRKRWRSVSKISALTKGYGTCLLLAAVKANSNSGKGLLSSGP